MHEKKFLWNRNWNGNIIDIKKVTKTEAETQLEFNLVSSASEKGPLKQKLKQ